VILGAPHWSWKYFAPSELSEILGLVFEVVNAKLSQELADADDGEQAPAVAAILSHPKLPQTTATPFVIDPRNVLASLLYLRRDEDCLMRRLMSWLLRIHGSSAVLSAALEHIQTIQRSVWLHLLGHQQYSMVPRFVSTLADRCFAEEDFTEHELLVRVCTVSLIHTPGIRSRLPAGFVFFARPVLKTLLAAVTSVDLRGAESSDILKDLGDIRRFVEEDLLWKEGKLEILRQFDCLFGGMSLTPRFEVSLMHRPRPRNLQSLDFAGGSNI
jgi:hypothetical protein